MLKAEGLVERRVAEPFYTLDLLFRSSWLGDGTESLAVVGGTGGFAEQGFQRRLVPSP